MTCEAGKTNMIIIVKGRIFTGLSEGRKYTELPWVRKEINKKLSFTPYPGTLNLSLSPDEHIDDMLEKFKGWEVQSKKGYFQGRFYRALIMGRVQGAVIRPDVQNYPKDILEVVAPVCLRDKLQVKDYDEIEIKIWLT